MRNYEIPNADSNPLNERVDYELREISEELTLFDTSSFTNLGAKKILPVEIMPVDTNSTSVDTPAESPANTLNQDWQNIAIEQQRALDAALARIEELEKTNTALKEEGTLEPMTKLLNKVSFKNETEELIRNNVPFALFSADLMSVKAVNDLSEDKHHAGDRMIINTANVLRVGVDKIIADKIVSPENKPLIGRLGGDEFGIVIPLENINKPSDQAIEAAKQVVDLYNDPEGKEVIESLDSQPIHEQEQYQKLIDKNLSLDDVALMIQKEIQHLYHMIYVRDGELANGIEDFGQGIAMGRYVFAGKNNGVDNDEGNRHHGDISEGIRVDSDSGDSGDSGDSDSDNSDISEGISVDSDSDGSDEDDGKNLLRYDDMFKIADSEMYKDKDMLRGIFGEYDRTLQRLFFPGQDRRSYHRRKNTSIDISKLNQDELTALLEEINEKIQAS